MHDIILGVAFIAMVAAPAMVATLSGKKEYDPDPEASPSGPAPKKNQIAGEIIRPRSAQQRAALAPKSDEAFEALTLPMFRSRGMNNR